MNRRIKRFWKIVSYLLIIVMVITEMDSVSFATELNNVVDEQYIDEAYVEDVESSIDVVGEAILNETVENNESLFSEDNELLLVEEDEGTISEEALLAPEPDGTIAWGESGDTAWELDIDGVLSICGGTESRMDDYSTVYDLPWFDYLDKITAIKIESVEHIGNNAFLLCTNVSSISLDTSIKSIGTRAFSNCESLASITIPSSVTSIGAYAFDGCKNLSAVNTSSVSDWMQIDFVNEKSNPTFYAGNLTINGEVLTSVVVPENIADIKQYSFNKCSSINSVSIHDNVTTLGKYAFGGCSGITQVYIPGAVTVIEDYAFYGCTSSLKLLCAAYSKPERWSSKWRNYAESSLLSVTWDYNLDDEAYWASVDKTADTIVIPTGITKIPDYAFSGCSHITSITIPTSVKSIATGAFYGCTGLKGIYIPSSVTTIGQIPFGSCSSSLKVYCGASSKPDGWYSNWNNSLAVFWNYDEIDGRYWSALDTSKSSIIIPSGITKIPDNAFNGITTLTSITIPDTVTSIGSSAFFECTGLTSVTIPESVTSIGTTAFRYCTGLENVYTNSLESWMKIEFKDYESNPVCYAKKLTVNGEELTELVVPESISEIKKYAFYNCKSLKKVTTHSGVTSIGTRAFGYCNGLTEVNLKEGLTVIDTCAFCECTSLRNIYIPSSVTNIGERPFANCSSSLKVYCGASSKPDGWYSNWNNSLAVFWNYDEIDGRYWSALDTSKSSIIIPSGITKIPDNAFNGITTLTSITIPDTVTSIGSSAFSGCTNLSKVNISSIDSWCNIEFAGSTSNPAAYAHNLCLNGNDIVNLVISENVDTIKTYAFYGCSGIKTVAISDGVNTISDHAFQNCSGLTSITISDSVDNIYGRPFYQCSSSMKIYAESEEAKEGWSATWNSYSYSGSTEYRLTSMYDISSVAVAFDGCDGTISFDSKVVVVNDTYGVLPTAIREGYHFDGWYTQKQSGNLISASSMCTITEEHILYAHWTANEYEIKFDANGGSVDSIGIRRKYDSVYGELPTPTYSDKLFDGWYTAATGGAKIASDTLVKVTSVQTLYAHWRAVEMSVIFDAQGGSCDITNDTYCKGESIGELPIASLEGKMFDGWYTAATGGSKVTADTVIETEDTITLYAHWNTKFSTVVFDPGIGTWTDEGAKNQQVEYAKSIDEPAKPANDLKRFTGWYLDDVLFDFSKLVVDDITLVAGWTDKTKAEKPVSNIESASVVRGTKIKLSSADNISIYYTLDGSEPSEASSKYIEPIEIVASVTVKAIAIDTDYFTSDVAEYAFEISEADLGEVEPEDVPGGVVDNIPEGLWIAGIDESGYEYTGKAICPDVRIYDGNTLLTKNVDYTVSFLNNVNIATSDARKAPTVKVKGKGNYSGTVEARYTINQKSICDIDVSNDEILVTYNKKVQKITPTLFFNGKKLVNNKDFKVTYIVENENDFKSPGTYDISITGIGNYAGTKVIKEVITSDILMTKATVEIVKSMSYTGEIIIPEKLIVRYAGKELEEGVHYNVTYNNNLEIGTAEVIITGTGNQTEQGAFVGIKKAKFAITGTNISKAKVGLITSVTYTGEEINQHPEIIVNNVTLEENRDYTVESCNNIKIGTATVVITGKGEYTGVVKKTFKIVGYDISTDVDNAITVNINNEYAYVAGGVKPEPEVMFCGQLLEKDRDFSLSYSNNSSVNDGSNLKKQPTVIIKGKGNFKGSIKETDWTIVEQRIDNLNIDVADKGYSTKSLGWKSIPTITDCNGKVLKIGKDYEKEIEYTYLNQTTLANGTIRGANETVEKSDILPVGTEVKVTVVAKDGGNYTGEISDVYIITEKSIEKSKIVIDKQYYTGKEIKLQQKDIKVTVDGVDLVLGTDYIITEYSNNLKKGSAVVTIKGIGSYGGTKNAKYTIAAQVMKWFVW